MTLTKPTGAFRYNCCGLSFGAQPGDLMRCYNCKILYLCEKDGTLTRFK